MEASRATRDVRSGISGGTGSGASCGCAAALQSDRELAARLTRAPARVIRRAPPTSRRKRGLQRDGQVREPRLPGATSKGSGGDEVSVRGPPRTWHDAPMPAWRRDVRRRRPQACRLPEMRCGIPRGEQACRGATPEARPADAEDGDSAGGDTVVGEEASGDDACGLIGSDLETDEETRPVPAPRLRRVHEASVESPRRSAFRRRIPKKGVESAERAAYRTGLAGRQPVGETLRDPNRGGQVGP